MKNSILVLVIYCTVLLSLNAVARTVTIENQTPYIFSVYTNSSIKDVLNFNNYNYEHISEKDEEGHLIELDLEVDKSISFYLRQINKGGEQIVAEAEAVAEGGIKAYAFYNLFNGIKNNLTQDSYFYPFVERYFPFVSIVTTAVLFGYEIFNRSLCLPGIAYEKVPGNYFSYKLRIKEKAGRIFIEKLKLKEKQD